MSAAARGAINVSITVSDIEGLYTADPRKVADATLIPEVRELTDEIMALGEGAGSSLGTGGMVTKLRAARIAMSGGCDMIITNGAYPERLYEILDGKAVGTRFYAERK